MTSVTLHPRIIYSKKLVLLEIHPSDNDSYIKFHLTNHRGSHIDGCNLFTINNYGLDSFYNIRESFGDIKFDLSNSCGIKVIGVDIL